MEGTIVVTMPEARRLDSLIAVSRGALPPSLSEQGKDRQK